MTVTNEHFDALKAEIRESYREFGQLISNLATKMDQRFNQVDKRFDRLEGKFDRLDTDVKAMRVDFIGRCDLFSDNIKITDRLTRSVEDRVISLEQRVQLLEERP